MESLFYLALDVWKKIVISYNGLGLCEEAELEAQVFNLVLNPLFSAKTPLGADILVIQQLLIQHFLSFFQCRHIYERL